MNLVGDRQVRVTYGAGDASVRSPGKAADATGKSVTTLQFTDPTKTGNQLQPPSASVDNPVRRTVSVVPPGMGE